MNYEIIVNKSFPIKDENLPKKLVVVGKNDHPSVNLENESNDILLEEKAAHYFIRMIEDLNKNHLNKIIPDSGYRTIEKQEKLLEFYLKCDGTKAYERVALPRTSEHHTGLAIDIAMINDGKYTDEISGNEPEIIELHNICHKYGFILRYPKDKTEITGYEYEPWHFRFVGLELAKKIYDNKLTLEEIKQKENNMI